MAAHEHMMATGALEAQAAEDWGKQKPRARSMPFCYAPEVLLCGAMLYHTIW